ncbi:HEAT repeat domain-containing protein [Aureliella helgolandensis]|uniref:HEAT repeat protein n=1 Tax=Aureliella helgolandensis TaxID=2527968 RepID=A0A518G526_9BACT|nr:HEAT repeat domain-containing protein [Aureliella helgolandensis]QDV23660.1 HEAT repeat protein [Aureliella helgolandensis]
MSIYRFIAPLCSAFTLGAVLSAGSLTSLAVSAPPHDSQREQQLLEILRSDSPDAEKAITCKKLAIEGSPLAVPELEKLLPHPQLSSWSRIALEAIPGKESDAALQRAAATLEGELLVGVINSLGVRRADAATDALAKRLGDEDREVVAAAAVALGRIGGSTAIDALRSQLANNSESTRAAAAEGCILCAEGLWNAGQTEQAVELYNLIRQAAVPQQRIVEATRGAILSNGQDGLPLLVEQLRSNDKVMFNLALGTAREFPGTAVDAALASELADAIPSHAALIVLAMADRTETVSLPAVLQAASRGPAPVREVALGALGRIGDVSCLETLLNTALEADADLAQAARGALANLSSPAIDDRIAKLLTSSDGKQYQLLIELVGQRRIAAVPNLLSALEHADPQIRGAALTALGETISLEHLPVLVSQVVHPQHPQDSSGAQLALKSASVRMPDREACATVLAQALAPAQAAQQTVLLEILSEVGGPTALQTLATAAKSDSANMQDTASRLLGKWNSVGAAPVLLDLAQAAPTEKYQVRALRGYIGLARKFDMPESQRVEMCRKAMSIAKQAAEKNLVLDVLEIHPSPEGLKLALEALQDSELKSHATEAAMQIATQVASDGTDVSPLLTQAGLDGVKLEIIKAEYGAGATRKDVTQILRKQAGNLPLIRLPSSSYNSSFGGDPTPGQVKQLTVRYRLNGHAGEASFRENAPVILPVPK